MVRVRLIERKGVWVLKGNWDPNSSLLGMQSQSGQCLLMPVMGLNI